MTVVRSGRTKTDGAAPDALAPRPRAFDADRLGVGASQSPAGSDASSPGKHAGTGLYPLRIRTDRGPPRVGRSPEGFAAAVYATCRPAISPEREERSSLSHRPTRTNSRPPAPRSTASSAFRRDRLIRPSTSPAMPPGSTSNAVLNGTHAWSRPESSAGGIQAALPRPSSTLSPAGATSSRSPRRRPPATGRLACDGPIDRRGDQGPRVRRRGR